MRRLICIKWKNMKNYFYLLIWICIGFPSVVDAQKNSEPVLFTVEKEPVYLSEFLYIFNKTSGEKPDYSRASLEEYLNLYINFKLKVRKAKDLQLDTIPELAEELNGYRRQLSDSYLIDKEVTEKLLVEAYQRMQIDLDLSHVLFKVEDENKERVFKQAQAVRNLLKDGDSFEDFAVRHSQDPSVTGNKGRIGFVTAPFPPGFYEFETQAYGLNVGEVSAPVSSPQGFHLLKLNAKRPAKGQIEIAHILVRGGEGSEEKIKQIYDTIRAGMDFSTAASQYSDDRATAQRGGYLGVFGINKYELAFEEASFSLENDGDISEPFQSSLGWHLVKRISKRDLQPFEIEKNRLEARLLKDPRVDVAKAALIEKIREKAQFVEYPEALGHFSESLPEEFLTFKWRSSKIEKPKVIFELINDEKYTEQDFAAYLENESRERIGLGSSYTNKEAIEVLYKKYVENVLMRFEEKNLEKNFPEFKALVREYEEGILLFEVTKQMVWDKASKDTAGLAQFYETHRENYQSPERAVVDIFRIVPSAAGQLNEIVNFAREHNADEVLKQFNKEDFVIGVEVKEMERPDLENYFRSIQWKENTCSRPQSANDGAALTFAKIKAIKPAAQQTLKDARGYVVADYQDFLDKEWINSLRSDYQYKINHKVLESIVVQ
jgi:peptidyl-prolyl cis-trans isomerase SurA